MLATARHTDISSGSLQSRSTGLANNSKIAYALFTGIVTDKIAYPIREICKNAWEVTKKRPFEVGLPTAWESNFVVRDYGPGLSHHFMMYRFTKLGESTKDAEGVGGISGWGFGSKSPLAYLMEDGLSGSYSVVSYRDGMERHYVVSLDLKGMPQVKLFMEQPTTEPSGLRVSFPVRREDIAAFTQKAKEILWSFEPRPVVTPALDFGTPEILARGEGWTMYDASTVSWRGPQVRVGPIMYPLHLHQLDGYEFIEPSDCVVFDVDQNAVQPTASREAIQYTGSTKKALAALIESMAREFATKVQERLDQAPTYFEACRLFEAEILAIGHHRHHGLRQHVSWRGLPIPAALNVRATMLSHGWDVAGVQQFSRGLARPSLCVNRQIVVEHSPSASMAKLCLAGLEGKALAWFRVKRCDRDAFLASIGNPADVITLDDYKVASTPSDSRPKSVRRRRAIGITSEGYWHSIDSTPIDLAAGGLFVQRRQIPGGYRSRRGYEYLFGDNRWLGQKLFGRLMDTLRSLQLFDKPTTILIPHANDELDPELWFSLGEYLELRLRDRIDPAQRMGDLAGTSIHHLSSDLRKLSGEYLRWDEAPEDLRTFSQDVARLYFSISAGSYTETESDRAFNALKMIADVSNVPAVENPLTIMENRLADFYKKYPLLEPLLDACSSYSIDGQKYLDHYFTLLNNGAKDHA